MSEYETIWYDWETGKHTSYQNTGRNPNICLMGYITYHAFIGALSIRIGTNVRPMINGRFEFQGIKILECLNFQGGYYFGQEALTHHEL